MSTKKYIRKITKKNKYSYSVILPKEIMENFKWRNKQKIVIKTYGKNKILISDWKKNDK